MKTYFLTGWFALITAGLMAVDLPGGNSLFNGTNLSGWTPVGGGKFYATNSVIRIEGGKGWLSTEQVFTNFIFELEWRGSETNYNSGIFVRASRDGVPWATNVWQVNLKQSAVGELLEGSQKRVTVSGPKIPAGEWVKFRIEAQGQELTLDVNGQRAWSYSRLTPGPGFLGLQAEGKTFEFRALRITELP